MTFRFRVWIRANLKDMANVSAPIDSKIHKSFPPKIIKRLYNFDWMKKKLSNLLLPESETFLLHAFKDIEELNCIENVFCKSYMVEELPIQTKL